MQERIVSLEGTEEHNVLPDERLPDKTINFWSGKSQPKQIAIVARPAGSSIRWNRCHSDRRLGWPPLVGLLPQRCFDAARPLPLPPIACGHKLLPRPPRHAHYIYDWFYEGRKWYAPPSTKLSVSLNPTIFISICSIARHTCTFAKFSETNGSVLQPLIIYLNDVNDKNMLYLGPKGPHLMI